MERTGNARCGDRTVQDDSLFHGVQIGPALRACADVSTDFPALRRIEFAVEIVTDMFVHFNAGLHASSPFAAMYGASAFRRKARALLSLDLVASTERPRISAVSSVDLPSTSRRTKTTL